METSLREILVVGGTGAQGLPIVQVLSQSGRYRVRVLTRNPESPRALNLAALPNVRLFKGRQNSQKDLHGAFHGVYGAFVNLDGFTLGEKDELSYGIRAYKIARHQGVKHFIWSNGDYALKKADWNEEFHTMHIDAKARIGDLILSHGQDKMWTSLLTVPPYMDMLCDGMYVPEINANGDAVWNSPAGDGKIPLMALEDLGFFVLWLFDHPTRSAGMDLEVATEQISFAEIANTFTRVTGRQATHRFTPFDVYMPQREPFPGAPANWAKDPGGPIDESQMTWVENFTAWWKFWGSGRGATRDMALLDEIHPTRIKSLEEWMKKMNYQGERRAILKSLEDIRLKTQHEQV